MEYELVIGLEVHVQLNTTSKAFCPDQNRFGAPPNTLVSPVSLALPGTLPRINREHVARAIQLGLALNCTLADRLAFDRKHYFYPDLPKGYQISQHHLPLCVGGAIEISTSEGVKSIRLRQIHLEEDAGKSIHEADTTYTSIDLNRAGAPLLEIVTEPDLRSAEEVDALMSEMRRLVRWLDISDGHMEQGSLRCDCNISLRPQGATQFGQRCEVKNLNSMRYARQAIAFESQRQAGLLDQGIEVEQETRQFDPVSGVTRSLRDKEDAQDYRYLPEPDLPALGIDPDWVRDLQRSMPKLPRALQTEWLSSYSITDYQAALLTETKAVAQFFILLVEAGANPQQAGNFLINQIMPWAKSHAVDVTDFPISIAGICQLFQLIAEDKLSHTAAMQQLLPAWLAKPDQPVEQLASSLGLFQLSDTTELDGFIDEILEAFPDKVKAYQKGKKGLLGFFMGQLMRKTNGKADPKKSNQLLVNRLENA